MSRKRNKKMLMLEDKNKMTTMERLSRLLFYDCLKNGKKIAGCFENDKMKVMAYTLKDGEDVTIDDISCYIITPTGNPEVSVYVDEKTIDVSLGKKASIAFNDKQLEVLAANIICYMNDFAA